MPDWLVIGQENWDEVERRNQLLMVALATRHPRSRFLFAELPLRSRQVRDWRMPRLTRVAPNIWTVRPIRPLPGGALQGVSDHIECAQLRRAVRALGMEAPMLWTQDPRTATLIDLLPADGLVYDLTDDWAAFENDPARRSRVQANIEMLGGRAELVLACSQPLERAAHAWSNRVDLLPNAVDPPTVAGDIPVDLADLPRPRLGYVGTMHASRLDVELLAQAAEQQPSWSFVLLGPDELGAEDRDRLLGLPNVHFLGVRPHADVRGYLEGLDVCLLPHRVTEFTRSLDPLKLYEYLAAGRPVVATPVDNSPHLREHIAVVATSEELVDAAAYVIAQETPARASARRDAVAGETWDARARVIEAKLRIAPATTRERGASAVIVSHNTRDLLQRCLTDLQAQDAVLQQTIVVDNDSTDGSIELMHDEFPGVEVIEFGQNFGFGRANNAAFARCRCEYILLLNSDAFLAPGALAQLVAAVERHPQAGAVAPRLHNPDGSLQRSAWPFPTAWRLALEAVGLHIPLRRMGVLEDLGTWAHDNERAVDFLSGACLLLRADALAEVGGFDEAFWLYAEEADLQQRLAARGWEAVLVPGAHATHVGGGSSRAADVRLQHFYAGQRRFLKKHGTIFSWPLARLALVVGSALRGRWTSMWVAAGMRR